MQKVRETATNVMSKNKKMMQRKISLPDDIIDFAQKLISNREECFEPVLIFEFDDEESAYDDDFIDEQIDKLSISLENIKNTLESHFGPPTFCEEDDEADDTPIYGSEKGIAWEADEYLLYAAIIHEDREMPLLLGVGVEF